MTIEQDIATMEEKLLGAFKNNDLAVLDELLHDSCLFLLPNGISVNKSMVMENYRSGHTTMTSLNASEQQINLLGDNAIVSLKLEMIGHYGEQALQVNCRYMRVWKSIDGQWKVISVAGVQL